MAVKIISRIPVIEIAVLPSRRFVGPKEWDERGAEEALRDALEAIKGTVPRLLDNYDTQIDWKIETERRCEHCNMPWSERGLTYNGGCCDKDAEADPANAVVAA